MSEKIFKITAEVDYVVGHLRHGYYEWEFSEEEHEEFLQLSSDEQDDWIKENGYFVLNDYRIDDIGTITEIKVREVK